MNHTIPNPQGIQKAIQNLQTQLYNSLIALWGDDGLNGDSFTMYGYTYRNYRKTESGEGYIPEWYKGDKEYTKSLFFEDTLAAQLWFDVKDNTKIAATTHTYDVSLYGFVNLDKLKPGGDPQRMDEPVVNDILRMIEPSLFGFVVTSFAKDVDAVLSRYSGMEKRNTLNRDMQPFFCFRIDLSNMLALGYCGSKSINYPTTPAYMTTNYMVIFKDNPNTALRQRLNNGVYVQVEFPTGNTVTIPFLVGRTFNWPVFLDGAVYMTADQLPYSSGTFDNTANGGFGNDSMMQIEVNVN